MTRQKSLKKLGFSSYKDYLRSDLWKEIKGKVLKRDKKKCLCCGTRRHICVHHTNYRWKTLSGEDIKPLKTLCKKCHYEIEFDKNGKKVCISKANHTLSQKMKQRIVALKKNRGSKPGGVMKCSVCSGPRTSKTTTRCPKCIR